MKIWAGLLIALSGVVALLAYAHWPEDSLPPEAKADALLVLKSERKLQLLSQGAILKEYRVSLGPNAVGHKSREGDGKTPEGMYALDYRNPNSRFHLSLHVSYPNAADASRAQRAGELPGGMIMVHGLPREAAYVGRLHWLVDWTNGCIAVSNAEIEEIWRAVPDGTPIEIRP